MFFATDSGSVAKILIFSVIKRARFVGNLSSVLAARLVKTILDTGLS